MKKALKIIGLIILALLVGGGIYLWSISKPLPEGEAGDKANLLAQKMMAAVDKAAWDTTKIIQWTFPGGHDFVWDKEHHLVQVKWEDNEVLLNAHKVSGTAFQNNQAVDGEAKDQLIQDAYAYFCNDAFWLSAPTKAFDHGTTRSIVKQDDGSESLLVSYKSGGVTPGDSYLWHLDESGLPRSYEMWVSNIPVPGVSASWEEWKTLSSGAKYAEKHLIGSMDVAITNAKTANNLTELGLSEDLFDGI